jgi:maltose alpha-D-glucosyltransferase/alpha-amylase
MSPYRGWNAHSSSTESKIVKKIASATDPLWYKDAIIYELHVRACSDSNGDGIGDFPGLLTKLDYLQDLGVTCIWLLPFFPSPMRDDGYDISNYADVNPSYGTLNDFKAFLGAAHQRNIQVMIELVVNHTSDQHPWFKAARLAPPGSPQREMYVWSDNDQRYKDARIIFTDTEKSNWTWDETAKAYFWHRFFSHQPDLNYDNPLVIDEVLKAMRFWLDMGVDGLRIDAIPYLCEREGTSCENLPETHAVVRLLRAAIDADYANRLILAEANQWPADVRPYFGDGDECHMAFHFPLMPRIYMALRQEDRLPITDIMAQTPPIPDTCQWGLFLRNHDELTLEMVTDDERDYMYFAYSADPRMRINVGIRRRLAPLVDNNRRRIELLNSLLLSFPGTPILYYGDEIGMGDNIYLGDRNGVRTPMQWTSDRNAGFSKCDPARLYLPVVMDPIYGYQAINVEAQLSDQSSLLQWTRNMIALRKLFQVFGRGTLTFLNPTNRKILAYLRELDQGDGFRETVLCVANLSRFAQSVTLDLANYADFEAVEMIGYVSFPRITKDPYLLTLAPYSFLWLELQQPSIDSEALPELHSVAEETSGGEREPAPLALVTSWAEFLRDTETAILERALMDWLPRQRWFGAKTRTIESIRVRNWAELEPGGANEPANRDAASASSAKAIPPALFFFDVTYFSGVPDTYQIPLAISTGAEMDKVATNQPQSVITRLITGTGPAILHDAAAREDFHHELLRLIARNATIAMSTSGKIVPGSISVPGESTSTQDIGGPSAVPALVGSNTTVSPAPLSAQPGEAAQPPRTDTANIQSAGAQRLHPGESPSAGDQVPKGDRLDARASIAFPAELAVQRLPSRLVSAEQSNTSIVYGDRLILKIYRRLQEGENPDVEMEQFLSDVAHFQKIPPFYGEISTRSATSEKTTVAMLQGLVANEGDGWQWFLDRLSNWFESVADRHAPEDSFISNLSSERKPIPEALYAARESLEAAGLLGKRTAEMHLALSRHANLPAFAPEPITREDLTDDAERIEVQIKSALEALKQKIPTLDEPTSDIAGLLLSRRPNLLARARSLAALVAGGQRIRVHGDYHLGQTLRTGGAGGDEEATLTSSNGDFVILDFEGEPARSLEERRRKQSPLKDVAGMMRSFSYVSFAALYRFVAARDKDLQAADRSDAAGWARLWQNYASAMFLWAYRDTIDAAPALLAAPKESQELLNAYLLEKALYELLYELNNRPAWLHIPMNGILTL